MPSCNHRSPSTRLLWFLHFCLSKGREQTDLYMGSSPRHTVLEWQRHLWYFLEWPECGDRECLTLSGWQRSFFFFSLFITCGLTHWHQPASIRVAASSAPTQNPEHYTRRMALSILRSGLWEQQLAVGQTRAAPVNKTNHCRWPGVDCNRWCRKFNMV